MKNKTLMLVLLFLMPGTLMAQHPAASQAPHASVTSLTSKDLREFPGKEVLMITVGYPPAAWIPSTGTMHMPSSMYWRAR